MATAAPHWTSLADSFRLFALHGALYRLLGGRLVGRNTLILTTTGRRSGRARSTPLFYVRDGTDFVIVASNGGDARYPGWWHNVRADPHVRIQVGREILSCRAERASTADAPELWNALVAIHRGYEGYRRRTTRDLTMFRLAPAPTARNRQGAIDMTDTVSRRQAVACAGATLLAYVGAVHEVVGARLYPDGPAVFGGTLGWHAAGLSLVAGGLLLAAATLGVVRLPVVGPAVALGAVGAAVVVGEALVHGGFHFFAFTMVVAGILVALAAREIRHV